MAFDGSSGRDDHRVMKHMAAILVAVLGLTFTAACGGDDSGGDGADGSDPSDTSATDDDGSGDDDGDGGDAADTGSSGGATDLGDFPIPAPDGGTVLLEAGDGVSIDYDAADFDRIVQFYDDWTAGQPQSFNVSEASDTKSYLNDRPTGAEEEVVITVAQVNDFTNVILAYAPATE